MRRATLTVAMLVALLALGAAGLFSDQTLSWTLLDPRSGGGLWRALFLVFLLTGLAVTSLRFASKRTGAWNEFVLLAVLAIAVNFVVQLTGGLHSPWQALYLILAGFTAVAYSPRSVAALVGVVFLLEISNWAVHPAAGLLDLIRLLGLAFVAAAGIGFLEWTKRRKSQRVEEELMRLNQGLQEFERDEGDDGDEEVETTSPLSELGKRLGRVEYVRALDSRLGALLELVRKTTESYSAFLLRADPGTTGFIVRLASGPAAEKTGQRVSLVGSLLSDVLREERVLSMTEKRRPLPSLPWYFHKSGPAAQPQLHSLIAVPFRDHDGPQWILVMDHDEPGHFDEGRQQLAREFAEQMRQWLSSTRHLSELDILSNEFRRLYQASASLAQGLRVEQTLEEIVSFCGEVTEFETCAICLCEEGEDAFSVPVAEGYPQKVRGSQFPLSARTWAGWILRAQEEPQTIRFQLRTGMPVLYPGERIHLGAGFLGMPLLAKNRVSGALLLTRKRRPFSSNEVRLVRVLCNQAAIALENARVYGRVEQMAATDALTGLFNRRYFQQALEREMSRADRGASSIALMLLDIDHFKDLNDTYGHALGDAVLKKIADVLQGTLRKGDVLARYGGEEFVVLLSHATYDGAQEFAQRIWKAIGSARIHPGGGSHRVTASVGWALLPDDAETAESLIENADRALYFAKETGRNKVAGYHLVRAGVGSG